MMDGMLERIGDISKGFQGICDPAQMDSTLLFLVFPACECVTGTIIKIDDVKGRDNSPATEVKRRITPATPVTGRPVR